MERTSQHEALMQSRGRMQTFRRMHDRVEPVAVILCGDLVLAADSLELVGNPERLTADGGVLIRDVFRRYWVADFTDANRKQLMVPLK